MVLWVENMCEEGTGDEETGNVRTTGDKESYESRQRSDSVAWKEGYQQHILEEQLETNLLQWRSGQTTVVVVAT